MTAKANAAVTSANPAMGRRAWLGAKFRAAKKAAVITSLVIGGINAVLYALELSYPVVQIEQGGKAFPGAGFERHVPNWIEDSIMSLNIAGQFLVFGLESKIKAGSLLSTWAPNLIVVVLGTLLWGVCVGTLVFWLEDPCKRQNTPLAASLPPSSPCS